jgi:ParB family chromosome partitioning protein
MLMKLLNVPVDQCDYPSQPRSRLDLEYCRSLGLNMKTNGGQKVPAIGWFAGVRFQLADGGCRLEGAKLCGIPTLLVLDLGKEPSKAELLKAQASIDLHKQFLPPVDRARLFQANLEASGCTAKQLAQDLGGISDSLICRYLQLLTLAPDVQEQVNAGTLEWSKGCLIAQESKDHDRQRQLAAEAAGMTREALAGKLRKQAVGVTGDARVNRLKINLTSGITVTVCGKSLTLDAAIEAAAEARKVMDKGRKEGLTAKTIQKVSADRAVAGT